MKPFEVETPVERVARLEAERTALENQRSAETRVDRATRERQAERERIPERLREIDREINRVETETRNRNNEINTLNQEATTARGAVREAISSGENAPLRDIQRIINQKALDLTRQVNEGVQAGRDVSQIRGKLNEYNRVLENIENARTRNDINKVLEDSVVQSEVSRNNIAEARKRTDRAATEINQRNAELDAVENNINQKQIDVADLAAEKTNLVREQAELRNRQERLRETEDADIERILEAQEAAESSSVREIDTRLAEIERQLQEARDVSIVAGQAARAAPKQSPILKIVERTPVSRLPTGPRVGEIAKAAREAARRAEPVEARPPPEAPKPAEVRAAERAREVAEAELASDPIWQNLQRMKNDARLKPKEIEIDGKQLIDRLIELETELLQSRTLDQTAATLRELGKAFQEAGQTVKAYEGVELTVGQATSQINLRGVQARLHNRFQKVAEAKAAEAIIESPEMIARRAEAARRFLEEQSRQEADNKLNEQVEKGDVPKDVADRHRDIRPCGSPCVIYEQFRQNLAESVRRQLGKEAAPEVIDTIIDRVLEAKSGQVAENYLMNEYYTEAIKVIKEMAAKGELTQSQSQVLLTAQGARAAEAVASRLIQRVANEMPLIRESAGEVTINGVKVADVDIATLVRLNAVGKVHQALNDAMFGARIGSLKQQAYQRALDTFAKKLTPPSEAASELTEVQARRNSITLPESYVFDLIVKHNLVKSDGTIDPGIMFNTAELFRPEVMERNMQQLPSEQRTPEGYRAKVDELYGRVSKGLEWVKTQHYFEDPFVGEILLRNNLDIEFRKDARKAIEDAGTPDVAMEDLEDYLKDPGKTGAVEREVEYMPTIEEITAAREAYDLSSIEITGQQPASTGT